MTELQYERWETVMVRVKQSFRGIEIGAKFGKWEIIGPPFSTGNRHWSAVSRCECGKIAAVNCNNLLRSKSPCCMSCGDTKTSKKNTMHGDASGEYPTRLYNSWKSMKARCMNPSDVNFKWYGGRGIGICAQWLESYQTYKNWALANGYDTNKQIDRYPNRNGNYEPDNCRWVTSKENNRNRRDNRIVSAFDVSKCVAEWAEDQRCVVSEKTLRNRIAKGWNPERAIITQANGVLPR